MAVRKLVIDFGNNSIKASYYNEGDHKARLLEIGRQDRDQLPTRFYIPGLDGGPVIIGEQALSMSSHDPNGIITGIFPEIPTTGRSREVTHEELFSLVFKHIQKAFMRELSSETPCPECCIISHQKLSDEQSATITAAAKSTGFETVTYETCSIGHAKSWKSTGPLTDYVIVLDIGLNQTTFDLLHVGDENVELVNLPLDTAINVGGTTLDNDFMKFMITEGLLPAENLSISDQYTVLEQIRSMKEILYKHTDESHHITFRGKSIEVSQENISKLIDIFAAPIKETLGNIVSCAEVALTISNIPIYLCGGSALLPELTTVLQDENKYNFQIPRKPLLDAVLGSHASEVVENPHETLEQIESGKTFGVYQIIRNLGKGGMGEVWLAKHSTMDLEVALKMLHPHLTKDEAAVDRFMLEIRNSAKLNHPNIVRAHDAGINNGIYYLVSDFIDGEEVSSILKRENRLDERVALQIVRDVAQALKYAWNKHKMLHRDIKPENIMIDNEDQILLMDMGISKSMLETSPEITSEDAMLGTPHYMSPEQIQGHKDLDFRSDIYSLGATLYHMLTLPELLKPEILE